MTPSNSLSRDRGDFHRRQILTVTARAVIVLAAALLEHLDLVAARVLDDLGRDFRAADDRRTDLGVAAVDEHEHFAERDLGPRLARQAVDSERVALSDLELLALGLD